MLKKICLTIIICCFVSSSLLAVSPTENPYSDEQNFNLMIAETCAFLKDNIFEFMMSGFKKDKSDSLSIYTVTSYRRFIGGVTVLKLSNTDYVFIPILPSSEYKNPMWAVDLFEIISEYTGIRDFLIPQAFFESVPFSKYSEGYLEILSSTPTNWVLVRSKPCNIDLYSVKDVTNTSSTAVRLGLLESLLTDAKASTISKLKSLYDLQIDYDKHYGTFVDTRSNLFQSSDINFEEPSLFDYLEASTYLHEETLNSIDVDSLTYKSQDPVLFPISSFYIDLIRSELVSAYNVYAMLFNRFFIEPPSMIYKSKHEIGLDVLNEVFYGLPEDMAIKLKNALILLNGPALSIIVLDTIPIYLKTVLSYKDLTIENLYNYTDNLNPENILAFFATATDSYTANELEAFFEPRHNTLNIILQRPDALSLIWIVSTFEAIARAAHFNPLDIYNIVTVLSLIERYKDTSFSKIQVVNMIESLDMIIKKLTEKYPSSVNTPISLEKLVSRLERYKKLVLESESNDPECNKLFIFGH